MKTKLLAVLLSVTVAFSGIPAMSVSAAPAELETVVEEVTVEETEEMVAEEVTEEATEEVSSEEVTTSEEAVEEETTVESTEEQITEEEISTEEVTLEEATEEVCVEETTTVEEVVTIEETVAEEATEEAIEETTEEVVEAAKDVSGKAVGSNGIVYEGVAYLSMKNFLNLPDEGKAAYIQFCDSVAEAKESGLNITDVVISVDAKGNINFTSAIPMKDIFTVAAQTEGIVAENLELAESVKATEEQVQDAISAEELETLLTNGNYFRNQIKDSFGLTLYDIGKGSMVNGGRNTIEVSNYPKLTFSWDPICSAISALINTYPNKFNWADWGTGMLRSRVSYRYRAGYQYTYTLDKSKFYSSTLESKANKKVKELVTEAYDYAAANYPNAPTYGIIKYFDKWICENNYYNYDGTETEALGHTKPYYYCHSCYGILLYGYGVCESYALAMTRLLDAAGIRNIYAVGDAGGGHAWNYVEMPDGKWYMLDSTWNDSGESSNGAYLLCAEDGVHMPEGQRYNEGVIFKYPTLSTSAYTAGKAEDIVINKTEAVVAPKASYTLKLDSTTNATNYYSKYKKTWSSSDIKVAKVNANGKVTAVAPGKAEITCTMAGKKITSTVYVYKFTGTTFSENSKASYTWNYANPDSEFTTADAKTFTLTVGQTNKTLTAAQLAEKLSLAQPKATSSNKSVAEVTSVTLSADTIVLKVAPKKVGSAAITVKFGGKTSTLNVKVTQAIQASWFDFSRVVNAEYNGKAIKPVVVLSAEGKAVRPKVTFKVTYANNKNAGTATVTVTGTGKYGSSLTKNFAITQKDASAATFNKCTVSKVYNGKAQAAATTVKLGKTTLKAGVDYDVLYNGSTTVPTNVGKYTITIKTKGNYKTTTLTALKNKEGAVVYEIKATNVKKVTVTCPTKIKTGKTLNYKVKLGNNVVPTTDYTVTITDKDGNVVTSYETPGTYKLTITVKGTNILPVTNAAGVTKDSIVKTFKVVK